MKTLMILISDKEREEQTMIDLLKITPEQANKIECALLSLHKEVEDTIDTFNVLSEGKDLSEDIRKRMRSNRDWWQEVYDLIYGKE